MIPFSRSHWRKPFVRAAALGVAALSSASVALASQGPGAGHGAASAVTQLAMAVAVYGGAALVVGAGLIGAIRRRR
jgi:peptidoglycan/LPS O-acetylase OafA/YrhL